MKQRRESYEQPTVTVTEEEIEKQGKDTILKNLKKNNQVAFPPQPADISAMSRIEQLKYNSNAFKEAQRKAADLQ